MTEGTRARQAQCLGEIQASHPTIVGTHDDLQTDNVPFSGTYGSSVNMVKYHSTLQSMRDALSTASRAAGVDFLVLTIACI